MQSKEVIKKLADTYETLLFVSERHPSSMSRLKNLLMSKEFQKPLLVEKSLT